MGLFSNPLDPNRSFGDRKKYLDDFKIIEEKNAKGVIRKKAVYTGTWTVPLEKPAVVRRKLAGTLVLAAAMLAMYLWMLLLTHFGSGQYPVMIPLLAGLFPSLYLGMGVLALPYRGKPMRRDQYMHSFIRASRSALAVGVCDVTALLALMICRAVTGDWIYLKEDWLYTALAVVIPGMAAAVIFLLRSVDLTDKPNDAYESGPVFPMR